MTYSAMTCDIAKYDKFRKHSNLLNNIIKKRKKEYFTLQFEEKKNNLKLIWKLIGSLIKHKTNAQMFPTSTAINEQIADQLKYIYIFLNPGVTHINLTSQNSEQHKTNERRMLFCNNLEHAIPLYKMLDILTLDSIQQFKAGLLAYRIINHSQTVPTVFTNIFKLAKHQHHYNTRFAAKENITRTAMKTMENLPLNFPYLKFGNKFQLISKMTTPLHFLRKL